MKYVLLTVEHDQGVMFPVEAIEAESLSQAITIAEAKCAKDTLSTRPRIPIVFVVNVNVVHVFISTNRGGGMPATPWPSLVWLEYHIGTQEWHKATKDLVKMHDESMLTDAEFDQQWKKLGEAIKNSVV